MNNTIETVRFYQKKWVKITAIVLVILFISGGLLFWKADNFLNKISTGGGLLSSIGKSLPGASNKLKGEKDGRINILLLGMRGENVVGGGLLADTIIVASIDAENNRVAMTSVPRDLYVTVPDTNSQQKINAVYFYGEEKKHNGGGIENMKKKLSEILGQPIHYAVAINFKGFEELVDALGGIELHLSESFIEPIQFHEEKVCDPNVFTVSSGNFEQKIDYRGKIVAEYSLCYNSDEECGGIFKLPAGDVHLNGERALCYVRSRVTSNDFERARRQQEVIQELKAKALSIGTLTSFSKINNIFSSLDNNIKTDMAGWEMKRFFDLYSKMDTNIEIKHKVLENSEEGLLYTPEITSPEQGYILLPRGDNYNRIQEMFTNILPPVTTSAK